MRFLTSIFVLLLSLNIFAGTLNCTNSEVTLTADVVNQTVLENVVIEELLAGDAYGSADKELIGTIKGKYVRFKPSGAVNSEYKMALFKDFITRKRFPLFLDAWFEGGSGWYPRTLSCRLD